MSDTKELELEREIVEQEVGKEFEFEKALELEVDPAMIDVWSKKLKLKADDPLPMPSRIAAVAHYPGSAQYASFDIMFLTRDSLKRWLKSRGGSNGWAESTVMLMMGHKITADDLINTPVETQEKKRIILL